MRRRYSLVVSLAITSLIVGIAINNLTQQEQEKPLIPTIGGFTINTPERATNAAKDGVQVIFVYGDPPTQEGTLGHKLQSLHMKVVDGLISDYLHYYECNQARTINPPPTGFSQFCQGDGYPSLTSESTLLSLVRTHLQQVKDNPLIIGYWVLDDWALWDAGSARSLLIAIHQIIQQYTPERFAACGFGGAIDQGDGYDWYDAIADNFSPQGCDRVGLYIYSSSQSDAIPPSSPDMYNWSMVGILPQIFTSLKMRGWDISKEPLIGIGQAFGGARQNTREYWETPNAQNIETQSRSFCENGATGLAFYGWADTQFGPGTQTPMNNPDIQTGIQRGIAACQAYWSKHAQSSNPFCFSAFAVCKSQACSVCDILPRESNEYTFLLNTITNNYHHK